MEGLRGGSRTHLNATVRGTVARRVGARRLLSVFDSRIWCQKERPPCWVVVLFWNGVGDESVTCNVYPSNTATTRITFSPQSCGLRSESNGLSHGLKKCPRSGCGTPEGTRCQISHLRREICKVWIPSSRNPASVHRTLAFRWFESLPPHITKKKDVRKDILLFGIYYAN